MDAPDRPVVAVVGSLNVDSVFSLAELPAPGETCLSQDRSRSPGGKGANQAVAAARVARSAMVGAVADDQIGAWLVQQLATRSVGTGDIAVVPDSRTGEAIVMVAASGENSIVVDLGANARLSRDHVIASLDRLRPDVVLTQFETPIDVVLSAVQHDPGALVVVNPAPMTPGRDTVAPVLEHADVLVPNRIELGQLAGMPAPRTPQEVSACAAALGFAGTLVVTMGALGALVLGPGGEPVAEIPAEPVTPVDTTGAGDAFCGVLAGRLAHGDDVVAAARMATRYASLTTEHVGAQPNVVL